MRFDDLKDKFGDLIKIEWKAFMLRPTEAGRKTREEFIEPDRAHARWNELIVVNPTT